MPVDRAAVYVPGGRAPYPSTVIMGVVTASVAGVSEIAVCAPPGADGEVNSAVLGACRLAGASAVYRMGGAQAIAALAFGTETVAPVDVIVGPGNLYVQEAKRQVFGAVGIDGFAGPSDLVVLAAGDVDADVLALDLLAQAEHGAGSIVVAISDSGELIDALAQRIAGQPDTEAVTRLVQRRRARAGHWRSPRRSRRSICSLSARGAEAFAPRVRHAGCVFVGPASGTAFGDYIAGSNHVLPTNGAARFASALSPVHFRRRFNEVRIGGGRRGAGPGGGAGGPGGGLRGPRQVDGGPHSREWALMARAGEIHRTTAETEIDVALALDGDGRGERQTGVGFFDHMLDLLARHGRMDLTVSARGDLQTGAHHTVEDVGICIGQALDQALGDRAGISRYGQATVPMDESRASCAIDVSGRGLCAYTSPWPPGRSATSTMS